MSKNKFLRVTLLSLVTVVTACVTGAQGLNAAPTTYQKESSFTVEPLPQGITYEQFKLIISDLKNSSVPYSERKVRSTNKVTFEFPQGFSITFVDKQGDRAGKPIRSRANGKIDRGGSYITLNRFEKDMLMEGSRALLIAAICAIPGLGSAACAGITAIILAATSAVTRTGKCPGYQQMKIYIKNFYRKCLCCYDGNYLKSEIELVS